MDELDREVRQWVDSSPINPRASWVHPCYGGNREGGCTSIVFIYVRMIKAAIVCQANTMNLFPQKQNNPLNRLVTNRFGITRIWDCRLRSSAPDIAEIGDQTCDIIDMEIMISGKTSMKE